MQPFYAENGQHHFKIDVAEGLTVGHHGIKNDSDGASSTTLAESQDSLACNVSIVSSGASSVTLGRTFDENGYSM